MESNTTTQSAITCLKLAICSSVFIVNFEQVNADWETCNLRLAPGHPGCKLLY